MDKTLFLHIGGMKTGTTAVQLFHAKNRQALKAKGFCYPGTDAAHWGICANLREHTLSGIQARPGTFVRRCLDEIHTSSCHTHIMSAECLAGQGGAATLRELIPGSLAVKVVYYARRQDALIESWYNEMVKSGHFREGKRLDEEFLTGIYPIALFDHARTIEPWAEAFGRENMIVRCYEKQQMMGDSISDFSGITGLMIDGTFSRPEHEVNTSLDLHHLEFVRLCNQGIRNAGEINYFLIDSRFSESRLFETMRKRHLLPPQARHAILSHYEESNQNVAREYLGRADGCLFYDPWPDPAGPHEPYPGLTVAELAPIIGEMITTLDRQQQGMEPLSSLFLLLNRAAKKGVRVLPDVVRRRIRRLADR